MIILDYLLTATKGILRYSGKQIAFDAFSHDTRQLIPGEMFVAVRGEYSDGHDYLLDAIRRGATGLLVEARVMNSLAVDIQTTLEQAGVATVVVEDTRVALQQYAQAILERWHPIVIAVTGSTGKTSTKEAIASMLASNFATFRSWQNYNDLLGLPLSLGRLEEQHEYAVLELSCDHPGEISNLCRITNPQIGILTNISPTQLQYFGDMQSLATELGTLLTYLPAEGTAVFNQDDALIAHLLTGLRAASAHFAPSIAQNVQVTWQGVSCELPPSTSAHGPALQLASHLLGAHHISTMFAAYTVGRLCGLRDEEIQQSLAQLHPLPGRLNPLDGIHGSILLDDTHNAAPAAVIAGLVTLKALPSGCRIAVLGDMLGLGYLEKEAHLRIGNEAAHCAGYLITRGERAALIAESAIQAGFARENVIVTSTHEDAAKAARHIIESTNDIAQNVVAGLAPARSPAQHIIESTNGVVAPLAGAMVPPATPTPARPIPTHTILIKGSQEMRMEKVTELLMAQPQQVQEQLVRQTPGWKQIVIMRPERPTWVEIDLSAIGNNTRRLKSLVGPHVRLLATLKADAYGHGALKVARTVLHNGASMLGVATVSEAAPLRKAGINAPILVFGYVPPWQMREAVRLNITVTLYALESALALSRAALALGQSVKIHVKIDTGMGRLGVRSEQIDEILRLLQEVSTLPGIELEGMYTHFAMADAQDLTHAHMQLARFQEVLQVVEAHHLRPPLVHSANSAATFSLPEAHFDMIRPGIALYGLDPSTEVRLPEGFRPALSFKTQVAQVKEIPAGECISYGCTYITHRPTRVAVLPVGYADGFRRAPSNWGSVLIHGQEAPILGRVCMDQCIVDVSHISHVRMGDEVVLIGQQGTSTLSAEQVAQRLGTINYEVVSEILARVPRVD
jgi:alanine racemase